MIKAMFPNMDITEYRSENLVLLDCVSFEDFRLSVSNDWWNAPYKGE